ncbi:MAG: DUF2523 domain-containing protein [Gallionellaceae bacterium]|jgi:hypothetical protein|nr:DUF2523 domain-containing protein [Gallionellaceae bacterium]
MESITTAINNLIDWISGLPAWIFSLFKDGLAALFDMLYDLLCYSLDMLWQAVTALIALVPVPSVTFNANNYLAGAPIEFISMLVAIRIPEAFAIIVAALGIRFLLGLIPVVRVGG